MSLRESLFSLKSPIRGWIQSLRSHKSTNFLLLNDGSLSKDVQIVSQDPLPSLSLGTAVEVRGNWVQSPAKGQAWELLANEIKVLGACPSSYPLVKARVSFDHLREHLHLRSRAKTFQALWRIRHQAIRAISDFFHTRDFIQIHTPILTSNDCEGGGEAFRVTTDPHLSHPDSKQHAFFPKPTYLTVSAQLHLEMMAASHARVYTLNPAFRAEPSHSTRHLAEFWMLEAEMAFMDSLPLLLDFIESSIQHTTSFIQQHSPEDIHFCAQWIDKDLLARLKTLQEPFARLTYTEAIQVLSNVKRAWKHPVKWGLGLQSEHERYLAEEYTQRPTFVTDYPRDIKPFYMKPCKDGKTVACVDLLVPKIGELVGGSLRQEDPSLIQEQILNAGLDPQLYDWYVDLRRYGTTPHGGFGMGLERYLAYITGMWNIKDWSIAPRYQGHCHF